MRVMLAEDNVLLREGMARLLLEEGHEVVASVGDADSLLTAIKTAATATDTGTGTGTAAAAAAADGDGDDDDDDDDKLPDVVVVDVRMPPTHTDEGIRAALAIREQWSSIGVLVLSQYVEKAYATELIVSEQDGVGYLLKDRVMRVEEFLHALERVGTGGVAFDPSMVRQLLARTTHTDPLSRLTPRERDVLAKMAEGHINSAIADQLYISQSAVEKHINLIFDKFELNHVAGYSRRVLAILHYLGT
ncbi:response regulator transcription factor [Kribbella catacumbae]|uniref:response regulator transcription factor n=1 Tax=Kribbella catacumbae TaxID=460086 RepID=UPI00037418FE|nr:response regulator transcription factor [Kribbella catacumbae]